MRLHELTQFEQNKKFYKSNFKPSELSLIAGIIADANILNIYDASLGEVKEILQSYLEKFIKDNPQSHELYSPSPSEKFSNVKGMNMSWNHDHRELIENIIAKFK